MENDAPQPRPSGIRPPSGPPTITAVGFSPEPDDWYAHTMRQAQDRGDAVRDLVLGAMGQAKQQEMEEARLRNILDWLSTEDASVARLTSELDFFVGVRSSVVEQLELEQMVQRPPREDRLAGSEVNSMVEVHQKALESVDNMIELLKATIAALSPEPEADAGT